MAHLAADRVMETTTTTGTGPFTVAGAPVGFQTWLAGLGNGNSAYYCAVGGPDWEIGYTTLTGGTTLSRSVIRSSNAHALVNFPAGVKNVFLDYPAGRSVFTRNDGLLNAPYVHIADTPPADPVINQIWWDSSSGNSFVYYNDGNSTQWVPLTLGSIGGGGGGGGIPEAPIDGLIYGRQDAAWAEVTGGGGGGGDVYLAADNEFTGEINHFRDINLRPAEDGWLNSGNIVFSTSVATWGDLGFITHDGTLLRVNNLKEGQSGVLLATNEVSLTVGGNAAHLDLNVFQDALEASFWFSSYTPDGFTRPMGAINAVKKQAWTSSAATQDADLVFYIGENGGLSERAKVTNRGVETAWEAYGPSWDGNYSVPTKDAIYDKIETMGGGGLTPSTMAQFDTACTDGDFVFQNQAATVTTLTATGAAVLDNTLTTTHTSSFATGATASGQTKTIQFGTGGVAGSTTTITYGGNNGVSHTMNGNISLLGTSNGMAISTTSAIMNLGALTTTGAINIGSVAGTGAITLGRSTANQTVNVADGATASGSTKLVNIGANGTSGSTTFITYGTNIAGATSAHSFNGQFSAFTLGSGAAISPTTGTLALGGALTTGQIQIGSAAGTGTIDLGISSVNQTVRIAANATTSGNTKNVQIGTTGLSGSTTNITFGSAVAGALVTYVFNGDGENMRITPEGRVGIGYTPGTNDATFETGGASAGGGMIRANTGSGPGSNPTDPGLILRNLSQANDLNKSCHILAQGRTVAGAEAPNVGVLTWNPTDVNWLGTTCSIDVLSAGTQWRSLTLANNGGTLSGVLQYAGLTVINKYASASLNGVAYVDGANELGFTVASMFLNVGTDGSSTITFYATQPGARNADRRSPIVSVSPNTFAPVTDNLIPCAWSGGRWTSIYLASAPVVGSDERIKTWRGGLTPEEIAAGTEIADTIGLYQLNDSIAEKGDSARFHSGVVAQKVGAILANHGLTPESYGFFCYDEWEEKITPGGEGLDDQVTPAGDRYSIRYEELAMFLVAAQHARMNALEARLVAGGL